MKAPPHRWDRTSAWFDGVKMGSFFIIISVEKKLLVLLNQALASAYLTIGCKTVHIFFLL
jgi:hypothetical protein